MQSIDSPYFIPRRYSRNTGLASLERSQLSPSSINLPSISKSPTRMTPKRCHYLTWADFQGKVPQNAKHFAWTVTSCLIDYKISVKGKAVKIKTLTVRTNVDKEKSWAVPSKRNLDLLKHEQGHLDIDYIAGLEFKKMAINHTFAIDRFQSEIQEMYKSITCQYDKWQKKYDKETEHGMDQYEQNRWNNLIDQMIISLCDYWDN